MLSLQLRWVLLLCSWYHCSSPVPNFSITGSGHLRVWWYQTFSFLGWKHFLSCLVPCCWIFCIYTRNAIYKLTSLSLWKNFVRMLWTRKIVELKWHACFVPEWRRDMSCVCINDTVNERSCCLFIVINRTLYNSNHMKVEREKFREHALAYRQHSVHTLMRCHDLTCCRMPRKMASSHGMQSLPPGLR